VVEKLLLRPVEAADLIGLGRAKTYALIRAGAIPSVRLGKSIRVPVSALREWVDGLRQEMHDGTAR
jgi:excisionase family DNA binding protein